MHHLRAGRDDTHGLQLKAPAADEKKPLFVHSSWLEVVMQSIEKGLKICLSVASIANGNEDVLGKQPERHSVESRVSLPSLSPRASRMLTVFAVGASDSPSVAVCAASFEQAKMDLEYALGKHIEKLLGEWGEDKSVVSCKSAVAEFSRI